MITIDLFKDFVEIVRNKYSLHDEMNCHSVIMHYFDWLERHIPQQKWDIKLSKEFLNYQDEIKCAVKEIEKEARAGDDLSKYLSTQTDTICIQRNDKLLIPKDDLLIDWGINHLHFGNKLQGSKKAKKGFANRTDDLLFIFRDSTTLYFLSVMKHDAFNNQELLKILYDNFPGVSSIHNDKLEVKNINNEDIKTLRTKKCNMLLKIDGNIHISPYIGVLNSGISIFSYRKEMLLKRSLDKWSEELREQKDVIIELIESATSVKHTGLDLRLVKMQDSLSPEWIIVEEVATCLKIRAQISVQLTLELLPDSHSL